MRQAPAFWWRPRPTAAARLLAPIGLAYGAATAWRMGRPGARLSVPVICIGNLVAGGAGKTPTAIAIAELLACLGERPAFLSRGYGREEVDPAPIRVDPLRHDAAAVGDEPRLLAAVAPTYVARDRVASGQRAIAEGATCLVLDDGLQNPRLHKSLALAVVDAVTGIGNGLCVPAGPLRAPMERQWPAVSALCCLGSGVPGDAVADAAQARGRPVWRGVLVPDPAVVRALRPGPLLAFAGIGRPEKFFATLRQEGLAVADTRSFPDHHRFTDDDLTQLQAAAKRVGARLVTTAKDQARLPAGFDATALPVRLRFDAGEALLAWLGRMLAAERRAETS